MGPSWVGEDARGRLLELQRLMEYRSWKCGDPTTMKAPRLVTLRIELSRIRRINP